MHTAVRSPLVAAATLVGAGVIAISPIAPAPPHVSAQVRLSMAAQPIVLENPVDAFAPVFQSALQGTGALINQVINNPTPILQSVLVNANAYAFALALGGVNAGVALSDAAWATPAAIVVATQQVIKGDVQGALATLHDGIVVPLGNAVDAIDSPVQRILQHQMSVAQQLVKVVPEAVSGVVTATISSIQQVAAAARDAGTGVATSAGTLSPIAVANAITDGAVNVAQVFVSSTIGGTKLAQAYETAATRALAYRSIASAIIAGRQNIADVISVNRRAEAVKAVAAATAVPAITAPAKSTGGASAAVKTVKTVKAKASTTHATKAAGEKKRTTGKPAK
jgi:hypothetical protein